MLRKIKKVTPSIRWHMWSYRN